MFIIINTQIILKSINNIFKIIKNLLTRLNFFRINTHLTLTLFKNVIQMLVRRLNATLCIHTINFFPFYSCILNPETAAKLRDTWSLERRSEIIFNCSHYF